MAVFFVVHIKPFEKLIGILDLNIVLTVIKKVL